MKSLKGKRILILQQRGWALNIGHFLAQKLQNEGCRLAAFTLKNSTHEFILNQKEVKYEMIFSNDQIMSRPKDFLTGEEYSLKEICEELGVDTLWPAINSLRHHVKSYKDKYYYGYKQNVPDEGIVDYVAGIYKAIKVIFDEFKPEFIIAANFVSLLHIMVYLYAKKHGVKMVAVTDTSIRGIQVFSYSYNDDEGEFWDRIDELNFGAKSENSERAKEYISEFRATFKQPDYFEEFIKREFKKKTLLQKLRHEFFPYKNALRWYLKKDSRVNFVESTGITIDYRPPQIILRDHYAHKRNIRFMDNFEYFPFEKLDKFIYFPLQYQPESTIDVAAPYFGNLIEAARLLAMSMPEDYTLVVKEHPAMRGLRPPSYIKKLARTVNVKLIDYRIPSEQVLKKADMVISANSTSLAQAAYLNKPGIQLGNLGTTLKLPNVVKHTDMTTMAAKIKELLEKDLKTPEYEKRLENFVAAAFDTGFDVNYRTVWEKGKKDALENIWKIYKKEIDKNLK